MTGGRFLGETPPHLAFVRDGLATVGEELSRSILRPADPAQILIDVVSLCFFPLAHADSLLKVLGVDPYSPDFLEARKRHVVDLVLRGLSAGQAGGDAERTKSVRTPQDRRPAKRGDRYVGVRAYRGDRGA